MIKLNAIVLLALTLCAAPALNSLRAQAELLPA